MVHATQLLFAVLAQPADVAQHIAPAMPWWWQAASGVSVVTAGAALWFIATYKGKVDRVIKIVAPDDDEKNLGNRVGKMETILYGDEERTDPGLVKRVHSVESGLSKDRSDFALFTERLEGILTRLEEKIDALACGHNGGQGGNGGGENVAPEPPRGPLPRVTTNPRIDVTKLSRGSKP